MRHDPEPQSIEIACSLTADEIPNRVEEWKRVGAAVTSKVPIEGGLRLVLSDDAPIGQISELARAEHECCAFFRFAITVDSRGVALEVTAPEEAAGLIEALLEGS